MTPCYLFDIDGTIADISHRIHHIKGETKDWRSFFAACDGDLPILHIIELAIETMGDNSNYICFGPLRRMPPRNGALVSASRFWHDWRTVPPVSVHASSWRPPP